MNRSVQHYLDLIIVITQKELKSKYKNNVLGYFWSIAHPLAFALVFYIAFKIVIKIPLQDYMVFLISGLFPWQWLATSVGSSPMVFLANVSIIKKVNFPRNIIPFTIVLQDMIHFVLSIPVIVLFMLIYNITPGWIWLAGIPLLLIIQFIFIYGIALAISSLNLFFRDLERLTGILITLTFYFTPIIYPETMIPAKYAKLVNLNPLTPLMVSWRNLFLHNQLDFMQLAISFAYALLFLAIGSIIYKKLSWKFAEVL
ncbi:MAG: ABC transporter permease [Deltaproteobacteria bacterium]